MKQQKYSTQSLSKRLAIFVDYKEKVMNKPTHSQIIQAVIDVILAIGNDANTYLASLINVSAYTKQQRDSAEVQNIINSIQVN